MILTPILLPGAIFLLIVIMNFFLLFAHSSGVIPARSLFFIILLWFLVSVPLSFAGSIVAHKQCNWDEHPTKTNQIARQIPYQPWYLRTAQATLIAGIFSFGSIAVELYFIYSSLWFNKIFYMFGFLLFSFLLLTLTTSLVTILITYYSLCLENWLWQWRSFIIGGLGCSIYTFIHSILFTKFKLGGVITVVLYLGYSLIISALCCVVTGAIGFFSSMFLLGRYTLPLKLSDFVILSTKVKEVNTLVLFFFFFFLFFEKCFTSQCIYILYVLANFLINWNASFNAFLCSTNTLY